MMGQYRRAQSILDAIRKKDGRVTMDRIFPGGEILDLSKYSEKNRYYP